MSPDNHLATSQQAMSSHIATNVPAAGAIPSKIATAISSAACDVQTNGIMSKRTQMVVLMDKNSSRSNNDSMTAQFVKSMLTPSWVGHSTWVIQSTWRSWNYMIQCTMPCIPSLFYHKGRRLGSSNTVRSWWIFG